jgi:membrane-associated phospholipid phosphatase
LVTASRYVSNGFAPAVLRVVALLAAAALWLRRRRADAVLVAVGVTATYLLSSVAKVIVARPRPRVPHPVARAAGASYPSGHALTSLVAVGVLLMVLGPDLRRRPGRAVLVAGIVIVIVLMVGASRLLLGVHYLSDVLGGWLLGAAWLLALEAVRAAPRPGRSGPSGSLGWPRLRSPERARSRRS